MKRCCGSSGRESLEQVGRSETKQGGRRRRRLAGQRARVSQHCAVKVRRRLCWKARAAQTSSGKNGKSLASGSHDRKHNLPHCSWWKISVSVNRFMQCDRLPACLMHIWISGCYMLSIQLYMSCIFFPFALPHCIQEVSLLMMYKDDSSYW